MWKRRDEAVPAAACAGREFPAYAHGLFQVFCPYATALESSDLLAASNESPALVPGERFKRPAP